MAIETKLAIFKDKYSLPDDAVNELKTILDSFIVEFAHKIMNSEQLNKTIPKLDTTRVMYTEKKFATKIADEYASECNVTLEEIPSETGKVTKKDVEKYVKSKTGGNTKKSKNPTDDSKSSSKSKLVSKNTSKTDIETEADSETETKKTITKKEKNTHVAKEKCNGVTKDGNPCNLNATKTPDGSKKCYCFRHAVDWKQYEVSSDSDSDSDDENDSDKKIQEDLEEVND